MTKSPLLALLLGGCLVGGSNDTKTTHIIGGTGDSAVRLPPWRLYADGRLTT